MSMGMAAAEGVDGWLGWVLAESAWWGLPEGAEGVEDG